MQIMSKEIKLRNNMRRGVDGKRRWYKQTTKRIKCRIWMKQMKKNEKNTLPGRCERENSSLWRRILSCDVESVSPKLTANPKQK